MCVSMSRRRTERLARTKQTYKVRWLTPFSARTPPPLGCAGPTVGKRRRFLGSIAGSCLCRESWRAVNSASTSLLSRAAPTHPSLSEIQINLSGILCMYMPLECCTCIERTQGLLLFVPNDFDPAGGQLASCV